MTVTRISAGEYKLTCGALTLFASKSEYDGWVLSDLKLYTARFDTLRECKEAAAISK